MPSEPRGAGRLDPEMVAGRTFPTTRRGFDQEVVRDFLVGVAAELRALAALADTPPLDSASAIEHDAELRAADLLREAQDEARRLLSTVQAERDRGYADGLARADTEISEAQRAAALLVAGAEAEAVEIIGEARAAREKVLGDLGRRRQAAKIQVEQLHAARDRLMASLAAVRQAIEEATAEMRTSLPEAKAAADAAARRVEAEPVPSVAQLESELEAMRLVGLPLFSPEPPPEPEPRPADEAAAVAPPEAPDPPVRQTMPRVVRHRRDATPTLGLPEGELHEVDPAAPFEEVRLVAAAADADAAVGVEANDVDLGAVVEALLDVEESALPDDTIDIDLRELEVVAVDVLVVDETVLVEEIEVELEALVEVEVEVEIDELAPAEETEPPDEADERDEPAGPSPEAVDALFARLRAGRSTRTAAARDVLDDAATSTAAEPRPEVEVEVEVEVEATAPAPVAVDDVTVHVGGGPDREALLARRDGAIAPAVVSLGRRLKRLLADEQNELLDLLRRSSIAADALAAADDHAAGWAQAAGPDLALAASAGAAFHGGSGFGDGLASPADVADVADDLATALARPLHARLMSTLAATDDVEAAADGVRSVYREWRASRLTAEVDNAVLAAFATGLLRAEPSGRYSWVVDDGDVPCADCEDNALEGPLMAGEPFPTGHDRPPAHAGCRCLLVPAT